jgi:hypothetical protein
VEPETGFDAPTTYAGFSAQNVQLAIPEAVGQSKYGFLTLQDRPLIALERSSPERRRLIRGRCNNHGHRHHDHGGTNSRRRPRGRRGNLGSTGWSARGRR